MTDLNLQYQGFLNTPNLWIADAIYGFKQLDLPSKAYTFNTVISSPLRLGKLVERFVSHQLKHDESISILAENIQIQDGKLTIGEIDCLLKQNNQNIHLEIVYKFYLYDDTVGDNELAHWIGPNRKDSLIQKLAKLKEKQLPILYSNYTEPILKTLNLKAENIKQYTCFKAQLFLPFETKTITSKSINPDCIKGFYINREKLSQFSDCQFFIPDKLNWLIDIPKHKSWLTYNAFLEKLILLLNQKKAPLCWMKNTNGETEKCFVVWW